jgi:ribosome maturation factor RimP
MDRTFLGKKEIHGTLMDVENEGLTLDKGGMTPPLRIPFNVIRRINLVYDFDRNDFL